MRPRQSAVLLVACLLAGLLPAPVPAKAADPTDAPAGSSATVSTVDAGGSLACAIRTDGTLACWGISPSPPVGRFIAVSAGVGHACAIRTDGTLACWGDNEYGQASPPPGTFTAVSAGLDHACAIRTDGTLACWGGDEYGQASPPPGGTFTAVSAGGYGGDWGIRTDGTLACWGPCEPGPLDGAFTAVSAGWDETCAIRTDGTLACWGTGEYGVDGTFSSVSAGGRWKCAIRTDGTLACWGLYDPEPRPPDGTFTAVSVGFEFACAIRTEGTLACWGDNEAGQVEPGPELESLAPWRVSTRVGVAWSASRLDVFPARTFDSFDVRYVRYSPGWRYGGNWHRWLTATTATRGTFRAAPGYTYCFQARGREASGGVSTWDGDACTSIPLDDRSLNRSAGWTARSDDRFYRGTALRSSTRGASLTLPYVIVNGIALVATTCPTCGTVEVYVGRSLPRTIRLTSPTRKDRVLIPVYYDLGKGLEGKFRIRIASSGHWVIIDGVAFRL